MLRKTLKTCGGMLLALSLALPEFVLPAGALPIAQPAVILSGQLETGQGVIPVNHGRRHWRRGYGHRFYRGYYPRRHSGIYLNFGLPLAYYGGYGGYGGYYGGYDGYYGGYGGYNRGYGRYARGYRGNSSHVRWCRNRYRSYNARTDTYLGYDGDRHRCRGP